MKGIILAGGSGTRMAPITLATSKQLLPVYDKPLVYYPLSTLMSAGIRDILVISTPRDLSRFQELLGDGKQWGISLQYTEQPEPKGIAQALIIGYSFIKNEPVCLILGDNIFYGNGLDELLMKSAAINAGARIFGYYVRDPSRYGVLGWDQNGNLTSLEEKPAHPKSSIAVPGIYFYDGKASLMAHQLQPSKRGELEITDLNRMYLDCGELTAVVLGRGIAWLDAGTHDALLEASNFVATIQRRQGIAVGCPKETAINKGWITNLPDQ